MMKVIVYTRADGGTCVCRPLEGARLVSAVVIGEERRALDAPRPVDTVFRGWPVDGVSAVWAETEDEFVARIAAKDVPADATAVRVVDAAALPADRTFRDAWTLAANGIEHDMEKCRAIHRDRLRARRAPLLQKLDVDYMRALEKGQSTSAIVAKKQALRDAPAFAAIDSARTVDELVAAVPPCLAEGPVAV
jgi:hypothetical protein